jgi:hypothetical protein
MLWTSEEVHFIWLPVYLLATHTDGVHVALQTQRAEGAIWEQESKHLVWAPGDAIPLSEPDTSSLPSRIPSAPEPPEQAAVKARDLTLQEILISRR